MPAVQKYFEAFEKALSQKGIALQLAGDEAVFTHGKKKFVLSIRQNTDLMAMQPLKMAALVQSKLGLNKTIFARSCEVRKIGRQEAEDFLEGYHIMSFTQSGSNFGLFSKDELVAVASFSKGRKMDRLPDDKRSFELIRFCCKSGITVTGGLTRLVKNFCREKNAGDVMTYVDKRFSEGDSFVKAGFVKHGETDRNIKLVYTP